MIPYLKSFLNQSDPTTSLKHAAFALVILSSCGWLTYALIKTGMDASWAVVYATLVGAVSFVKVKANESNGDVPKP